MVEITKNELAQQLADYSRSEQRDILRAARHLQRFVDLTSDELTEEEETDDIIKELEEDK